MKIRSFNSLPVVDEILESRQEIMKRKIYELAAALQDKNKWLAEIGDQLVYLKYYAAGSFQAEKEVMLRDRYPARAAHMEQHESLTKEMSRLLERIIAENPSISTITEAINQLLSRLKKHIADHDKAMMATNHTIPQSATAHQENKDFGFNFFHTSSYTA